MTETVELQPKDDSLMTFDGTILEVFAGGVSGRFHIKGITGIEITEGWSRSMTIKNRFGSDVGLGYDKDRLPQVREFADRVLAASRG